MTHLVPQVADKCQDADNEAGKGPVVLHPGLMLGPLVLTNVRPKRRPLDEQVNLCVAKKRKDKV